jgi:hypothetical protein
MACCCLPCTAMHALGMLCSNALPKPHACNQPPTSVWYVEVPEGRHASGLLHRGAKREAALLRSRAYALRAVGFALAPLARASAMIIWVMLQGSSSLICSVRCMHLLSRSIQECKLWQGKVRCRTNRETPGLSSPAANAGIVACLGRAHRW